MLTLVRTLVAFAVVLGVLVFFHEFGHYLAARWRGVYVEAFSIGFGRAIFSWTDRLGTVWKIGWLPLGGYVRLYGQEAQDDGAEVPQKPDRQGAAFFEKSLGARAIIIAAGPIANFVLSVVLFSFLFATAGRPVSLPIVGQVVPDSAASRAHLQPGDRILSVNSKRIDSFQALRTLIVQRPDKPLSLMVARDRHIMVVTLRAGEKEVDHKEIGFLGIVEAPPHYQRLNPVEAVASGVGETWLIGQKTVVSLWQIVAGQRNASTLGGPLRIAAISGQVAARGLASLMSFIAVLSTNLGLINLLPIPVLDGGHLLFYLAEAVRGRPLSSQARELGLRAGLALILGLFVFVTWNDLGHLGLLHWISRLI